MTTTVKTPAAERATLQPLTTRGWRRGFANLLRKELSQWWGTRVWWIQLIIWMFILNGLTTLMTVAELQEGTMTAAALLQEATQTFLMVGATAIGIGVVATVQGAIVGEKQLGTADWVMSKPASRAAFILAKALAFTIGFLVIAVTIPAIIFYVEIPWLTQVPLALGPFAAGVAVLALHVLFYLALTLMLGTLFGDRGPITGIGVGFLLTGMFFKGMLPEAFVVLTPWLLPDISSAIALSTPVPPGWFVSAIAAGCWIIVFMIVALWRFSREEF